MTVREARVTTTSHQRWGRWLFAIPAAGAILLGARLFVWPDAVREPPPGAAAIVVLGGEEKDRLDPGLRLLERGAAPLLVLSNSPSRPGLSPRTEALCRRPPDRVLCVDPEPDTTEGEAETIARLSRERGWREIVVVTSRYHVTRAALLLRRCTEARVIMVIGDNNTSLVAWPGAMLHEAGGLLKAVSQRNC